MTKISNYGRPGRLNVVINRDQTPTQVYPTIPPQPVVEKEAEVQSVKDGDTVSLEATATPSDEVVTVSGLMFKAEDICNEPSGGSNEVTAEINLKEIAEVSGVAKEKPKKAAPRKQAAKKPPAKTRKK